MDREDAERTESVAEAMTPAIGERGDAVTATDIAAHEDEQGRLPSGPAAAAILAAGIGCAGLGILTTLAAISEPVSAWMNIYDPVGPLSGKTTFPVVLWLLVWIPLARLWRAKEVDLGRVFYAALALVAIGLLGTFPPVWELLH